jgi:peptidoglycan/LPS O-acetylase OafA/YrhL
LDWGPAGVRLFFVLSGFLITSLLLGSRNALDSGRQSLRQAFGQFYIRRTLRIFPLYYFVLFLALLFAAPSSADWADPSARSQLPWLATYTYNIFVSAIGSWPHYFGHFWTLSVEEQYYLFWPWVVLLAPRPRLALIAVALCLTGPIYRGIAVAADFNEVAIYAFPLANFDTLGMGSLLALLTKGHSASARLERLLRRTTLPLGALGIALLHGTALQPIFMDTMLSLVFIWLVAGASRGLGWFGKTVLEWRPLVFTGRISYGLYVYHMLPPYLLPPMLSALGLNLQMHTYGGFAVSAIITFAVASISWFLLEAPINRLKRHLQNP